MSYTVELIQGNYTVPEFVWEIYTILKNQGILIRPDDSLIQEGEDEVERSVWLEHCYTVRTEENYKGYFIISEKETEESSPIDKYLLYIGDSSLTGLSDQSCLSVASGSNPGSPGVRRCGSSINATYQQQIFSNNPGTGNVARCPIVIITDLEKEIIAHFPLGSTQDSDTKCYKLEGKGAADYLTRPEAYRHLYNIALKIITNDYVKVIEFSDANRSQFIPGHIVLGYIKGVGFNWITNFSTSSPYRHIGYQEANASVYQKFLSFEPNPLQVYFHHGLKYSYSGNGIEYGEKKFFVKGANGIPSFGFYKELSNVLLDCSTIIPNGAKVTIGNNTYYAFEHTLMAIGE